MNASRQTATNLQTQSATGDGTTIKNDLIPIKSEYIDGIELCFDRLSTANETMQIQLHDVQFVNTSMHGPRTDIEFRTGDADAMTVIPERSSGCWAGHSVSRGFPPTQCQNVRRRTPTQF